MTHVHGPILGIPEFDAPHADLLARADDLAAAARSRQARKASSLLDGLIEATALHFAYEDEWMDRTAYPDRVAHRTSHDLFLQDLAVSAQEIRASGVTPRILDWACGRLQLWLRFHIEKNDRALARHLERVAPRRGAAPTQQRS